MVSKGEAPLDVLQGHENTKIVRDSAGRDMPLMFSDGNGDAGAGVFSWFSKKVAQIQAVNVTQEDEEGAVAARCY